MLNIIEKLEKAIKHYKCERDDAIVVLDSGFGSKPGENDLLYRNRKERAQLAIDALEKQIPKKPTYVDTRFRNHGRNIGDGISLAKCYKCPNCWSHIFHVWDSEKYCPYCGQALDWGD